MSQVLSGQLEAHYEAINKIIPNCLKLMNHIFDLVILIKPQFEAEKKFISKGNKVKFTVKFKGREMQHTELGKELMDKITEETKDIAKVESQPKFEGKQMVMIIQPI